MTILINKKYEDRYMYTQEATIETYILLEKNHKLNLIPELVGYYDIHNEVLISLLIDYVPQVDFIVRVAKNSTISEPKTCTILQIKNLIETGHTVFVKEDTSSSKYTTIQILRVDIKPSRDLTLNERQGFLIVNGLIIPNNNN